MDIVHLNHAQFLTSSSSQKTLQLPAYILIIVSIRCQLFVYDTVSDVVESGVQWRSNFQIGSIVLKSC